MTTIDYSSWADRYDTTRGASPSVLNVLLRVFGDPASRSLLDIGCGTGNFAVPLAQAGFTVTLGDFTADMVRRALAKLPQAPTVIADGQRLPFRGASFDCAVSVNVFGHLPDWRAALVEARRVVRSGPFVLKTSTQETQKANWLREYLPEIDAFAPPSHYQAEETIADALRVAGFSSVEIDRVIYNDVVDGSVQALKWFPEALLAHEGNTAVFMRLPARERRAGLARIRADHESGCLRDLLARYEEAHHRYGDGSVFICHP
ncbi:MAG TPA: methyltransferase domain-containing protein [Dehalococcoidia bacterium]|nr:methyltransferase domain-containing protein [Dehalococcoidia bacterium]